MQQSYNYQLNFWDDEEEGARVLLMHVSQGLDVCKAMVVFFEEHGKLEKDYSRKLGAIAQHLHKQLDAKPDYGQMMASLEMWRAEHTKLAQYHSKQAEQIYRQNYSSLRDYLSLAQARLKTLDGKVRNLRQDKMQKRQVCTNLHEKLRKARVELREYRLNHCIVPGGREQANYDRQIGKWTSIVEETARKLDVATQEYQKSKRHWLEEWSNISMELQLLEESRIQTMKVKLQEFAAYNVDTTVQVQVAMEKAITTLNNFTAQDDIQSFSYNYGTGRIKSKEIEAKFGKRESASSFVDKHTQNMRNLSLKLALSKQQNGEDSYDAVSFLPPTPSASTDGDDDSAIVIDTVPLHDVEVDTPQGRSDLSVGPTSGRRAPTTPARSIVAPLTPELDQMGMRKDSPETANSIETKNWRPPSSATVKRYPHQQAYNSRSPMQACDTIAEEQMTDYSDEFDKRTYSGESIGFVTNPVEYTDKKIQVSGDSVCASISSYASSIDDSQRLVKSWNSENRRKSRTYSKKQDVPDTSQHRSHERNDSIEDNNGTSQKKRALRRKSLATDIDGALKALEEVERQRENSKSSNKQNLEEQEETDQQFIPFRRAHEKINWPKLGSTGEKIIGYAKALYNYTDQNEHNILNFKVGDYLLLTEKLNDDWCIGEVYNGDGQYGLIPMNYVTLVL